MFTAATLLLALFAQVPAAGERVWAKPDHFWFRKAVPGGHLWLTVDAKHGAKSPLFDHQRLAIVLNLRSGYDFTPLSLPFADPTARFVVKYECLPRSKGSEGIKGSQASKPELSPDGSLEAFVANYNVGVRHAGGGAARTLTKDGVEGDAYDAGSLRWAANSRSLTAYRLHLAHQPVEVRTRGLELLRKIAEDVLRRIRRPIAHAAGDVARLPADFAQQPHEIPLCISVRDR